MPETALQLEGVSAGYRGRPVVEGVSLTVAEGAIVALLGPNGVGKTTLLKVACGALRPAAGKVTLFGRDPAAMRAPETARLVAYVPQREEPAFDVTVEEVVLMGRTPHSSGVFETPDDRAVAREAMARAGCSELSGRPLSELSGGESQRALVARALAQGARLILMDEPTNHLDPSSQGRMRHLIRGLAAEGKAILLATHDLNWAAACADWAVLLAAGRVALQGPPDATIQPGPLGEVYGSEFVSAVDSDGRRLVAPRYED